MSEKDKFSRFRSKEKSKGPGCSALAKPIELKLSEYVPYGVLLYISSGEQDPSTTARVMARQVTAGRSKTRKIAGWRTLKPPFSPVEIAVLTPSSHSQWEPMRRLCANFQPDRTSERCVMLPGGNPGKFLGGSLSPVEPAARCAYRRNSPRGALRAPPRLRRATKQSQSEITSPPFGQAQPVIVPHEDFDFYHHRIFIVSNEVFGG